MPILTNTPNECNIFSRVAEYLGVSTDDFAAHVAGTRQLSSSTAKVSVSADTNNAPSELTAYLPIVGKYLVIGKLPERARVPADWVCEPFHLSGLAAELFGNDQLADALAASVDECSCNAALYDSGGLVMALLRYLDGDRYLAYDTDERVYRAVPRGLTRATVLKHLAGTHPISVHLAKHGSTAGHVIVFDFDDHEHRDAGHDDSRPEVDALVASFITFVSERYHVFAVRSGSGTGFHVWIVFHEAKPLAELGIIADELLRDFPSKTKLTRQRAGAGQKGCGCLDGLVEVMPTGGKTAIALPLSRKSHRVEVRDGELVASDDPHVQFNCDEPTKEAAFAVLADRYDPGSYDGWWGLLRLMVATFGVNDAWARETWIAWSETAPTHAKRAKIEAKWYGTRTILPPDAFWRESGLVKTPGRWVNPGDKAAREICRLELAKPGVVDVAAIVDRIAATDCSDVALAECRGMLAARLKADGLRLDTLNAAMSAAKKAMSAAKKRAKAEAAQHAASALDDDIVEFNNMYAYIKEGSKCGILTHTTDTIGGSTRDLYYIIDSGTKGFLLHEAARREAAEKWLVSPHRRNYNHGFIFDPTDETVTETRGGTKHPGRFNLWRSWSVEQKQGDWSLMQAHILNVIADGNAEHAEYIVNYIAWCLQNPELPAEVALVMQGREGTGKGVLARSLVHLAGQHAMHITRSEHLVGKFNLHLRDCILLFSDEAFYGGDKKHEGALKGLITEPRLVVEKKGADVIETDNHVKVVMSTNEEWAIPAGADARRFAVFKVADTHKDDEVYFNALYAQMAGGGHAALLYDLLRRDIGNFHPRRNVPQTDALREQKHLSEAPHVALMREFLHMGALPGCKTGNGTEPNWAVTPFFRESLFKRGRGSHVSDRYIGLMLGALGGGNMKQRVIACGFDVATGQAEWKRCAVRELPSLAECRLAFDKSESWDDQQDWVFESEPSTAERVF